MSFIPSGASISPLVQAGPIKKSYYEVLSQLALVKVRAIKQSDIILNIFKKFIIFYKQAQESEINKMVKFKFLKFYF